MCIGLGKTFTCTVLKTTRVPKLKYVSLLHIPQTQVKINLKSDLHQT